MAITVDELVVEIKAETQGLRRGLDQVDKSVKQVSKSTEKSLISFRSFAKIAAVIGLGRIASEGVSTIRTFQDLEASLKAITGSAANAAISIDLIRLVRILQPSREQRSTLLLVRWICLSSLV